MSAENQMQLQTTQGTSLSIYTDESSFEWAQRIAKQIASSGIVPSSYQGDKGVPNVMVALEMSKRLGIGPIEVMQNLNVISGNPSWKSPYVIARINSSGLFKSKLKFTLSGEGDKRGCLAYAVDLDGEVCEGTRVTIEMAKKEGWYNKSGSKWPNMPELMLKYRAVAFFAREHCPEILLGLQTSEEIVDVSPSHRVTVNSPVDKFNQKVTNSSEILDSEVITDGPINPLNALNNKVQRDNNDNADDKELV